MKVTVNIGRLVLDGVDVPPGGRAPLGAALEAELGRLLARDGLPPSLQSGRSLESLSGGEIQLARDPGPGRLGQHIASAFHRGLRR